MTQPAPLRHFQIEINGSKVDLQAVDEGDAWLQLFAEGHIVSGRSYMILWREKFLDDPTSVRYTDQANAVAFDSLRGMGMTPSQAQEAIQVLKGQGLIIQTREEVASVDTGPDLRDSTGPRPADAQP